MIDTNVKLGEEKISNRSDKSGCSTVAEKILYGLADVGANLCWSIIASFVTLYYTDSVGLTAAFAGTMMLFARLLDGVTDVIGSAIIEKLHLPGGKTKPWFIICAPFFGICIYLNFNIPVGLSMEGKQIYAAIVYTFTAAIVYTIYNLAFTAVLGLISTNLKDRDVTGIVQRIITSIGYMSMVSITPILLKAFGGENSQIAWSRMSLIYGAISFAIILIFGLVLKEKIPRTIESESNSNKVRLKSSFKAVAMNKYFWLLIIIFIAVYLTSGINGTLSVYYYRDVLKNINLMSYGTIAQILPSLIVLPFLPKLFDKYGKRKVGLIGGIISIASCIVKFVFAKNAIVFIGMTFLYGFASTPITGGMFLMVIDVVDYVFLKKGIRAEAIASMASSIGMKLGTGIGTAIGGWGLALAQYNPQLEVQSAKTIRGLIMVNVGIPIIVICIMVGAVALWDVGKYKDQIQVLYKQQTK